VYDIMMMMMLMMMILHNSVDDIDADEDSILMCIQYDHPSFICL